jgi:hypothetical protein
MKKAQIYILLLATLALSALFALSGCTTIHVDVPASAEVSGDVTISSHQAVWKSNALDDGEGRVDAVTTPTTDLSASGL